METTSAQLTEENTENKQNNDAGTKHLQNSYVYYKLDRMASSKNAFYN